MKAVAMWAVVNEDEGIVAIYPLRSVAEAHVYNAPFRHSYTLQRVTVTVDEKEEQDDDDDSDREPCSGCLDRSCNGECMEGL